MAVVKIVEPSLSLSVASVHSATVRAYLLNRRQLRPLERFLARATAALEGALDAGLDAGPDSHFATVKWLLEDEEMRGHLQRLGALCEGSAQVGEMVAVVLEDVRAIEADRRLVRSRPHIDDLWRDMRELLKALYHWKDEAEDAVFDQYSI